MAETKKKKPQDKGLKTQSFAGLEYDRPFKPATPEEAKARKAAIGVDPHGLPISLGSPHEQFLTRGFHKLGIHPESFDTAAAGALGLAFPGATAAYHAYKGWSGLARSPAQMYGQQPDATAGGETVVPETMPVTPTMQPNGPSTAGMARDALHQALGDKVGGINSKYGIQDNYVFDNFADSPEGRALGTKLLKGVGSPDEALQGYDQFAQKWAGGGKQASIDIGEPKIVAAADAASTIPQWGAQTVVIPDAHNIGFMSDHVVVVPGKSHSKVDPEKVLNSPTPPVVSQAGFVNIMKYLGG